MMLKRNLEVDHSGLRKRLHMAEIVNYRNNGQEHAKFPNTEATFIINHPFMIQMDFFDMQEEQKKAWEEQVREHEAQDVSK